MRRFLIGLSCLALAGLAGNVLAGVATGTIQVSVYAKDGGPLKGAQVTAETPDSPTKRVGRTSADGVALLLALDPATNYTVSTIFPGYNGARNDGVLVKSGERTDINIELTLSSVTEAITVTAETPLVDVTSAVSGQDIGLQLTESLPTGRSYQSYLQLVPGVLPDDPNSPGNPASRSGLNYRDIGGELGVSRDNFYFIEGINVTDPVQGTFGANLNTEIIQEQKIITGGIPAEYRGTAGLLSNVVTKFGGNDWSGSVNYFFQTDGLRADNENATDDAFDTLDTAFTVGGPIVREKAWFFASYRKFKREDDVTSLDTDQFLRTVENDQDQYYAKVTYQPTLSDRISATFLGDPTDVSGRTDRDVLNSRDFAREQGGNRFTGTYQRVFSSGVLDVAIGKHEGELTDIAAVSALRNDVIFEENQTASLADQQLGGEGNNDVDERDTEFARASVEWFINTSWGHHTLKGGLEYEEHVNFRNRNFIGGAQFQSLDPNIEAYCIANGCSGFTGAADADFISAASLQGDRQFDISNASDYTGLIDTINADPDAALYYALLDADANGTISVAEAGAGIVFDSLLGNPDGKINYNRDLQTASGPQETSSEGLAFYIQDTLQAGKWTFNVGVRAERWEHFATTGENIFKFDWEYAPRLSFVYDLKGDGRQKISGYFGRYYDPIRNNMTNFAGTLTGRITEEQVFVSGGGIDRYTTYRTRGGPVVQDAFFSPTTKTPFTDEFTVGYQRDLGRNMSFEANLIKRKTRDILEDYDLELYAEAGDGTSIYPAGPGGVGTDTVADRLANPADAINDPDSLWLGLGYFGYAANPGSNFVIATLKGGERTWEGMELVFRKRYSNRWQGLASYSYARATGNTNSDSNADFQGDVLWLDPRAPNQEGRQPGLIRNLVKAAGSYRWDNGVQLGATWSWNSGTTASRTFRASRRNLPIRVAAGDEFEFAGLETERWIAPNTVGALVNPDYAVLDLRLQYNRSWGRFDGEFFVDLFNALDDQDTIRKQDLVAGDGTIDFGESISWIPPQRFFLGARASF